MFVVILTYTKPIEEIDKLRPAHIEFLDKYYRENIFVMSGRQVPLNGGIIIANSSSKEQLENILLEDPFNIYQVAEYKIIEFTPSKFNFEVGRIFNL